jgi:prepilin-type N-terminal cleavage/methylation domain-containing protein
MKTNLKKAGFTLVEVMIVVAIIGLLAAIAIPNLVKARQTSQTNACINNLRQLDAAKVQWALDTGQGTGFPVSSSNLQPYIGHSATSQMPACPIGGSSYVIGIVGMNPSCQNSNLLTHNAYLN